MVIIKLTAERDDNSVHANNQKTRVLACFTKYYLNDDRSGGDQS